jgi:hypothetical protein
MGTLSFKRELTRANVGFAGSERTAEVQPEVGGARRARGHAPRVGAGQRVWWQVRVGAPSSGHAGTLQVNFIILSLFPGVFRFLFWLHRLDSRVDLHFHACAWQ